MLQFNSRARVGQRNTQQIKKKFVCVHSSMSQRYALWATRADQSDIIDVKDMEAYLEHCKPLASFKVGDEITPLNRMDTGGQSYTLSRLPAQRVEDLRTEFKLKSGKTRRFCPAALPQDILAKGAFEGKYLNDCMDEFPREWWEQAIKHRKLRPQGKDPSVNCYGVRSSQSLSEWRRKGWIYETHDCICDNRGWFQWYCRYALGRRCREVDVIQMRRWHAYRRWYMRKPPRSNIVRQDLLHWAYPHEGEAPKVQGKGVARGEAITEILCI